MADLICRNTMQRCNTPGMCSPHGGCKPAQQPSTGIVGLERSLSNLLAVIHRDGGHFQQEHGAQKSIEAAEKVVIGERSEASEWQHAAQVADAGAKKLADYAVQLEAELEAFRKDAERYRWLRANNYDIGSYHPAHEHNASAWFEHLEDFDIDAAMKEDGV